MIDDTGCQCFRCVEDTGAWEAAVFTLAILLVLAVSCLLAAGVGAT